MTPAEIRAELGQLTATVTRLKHAWLAVRDHTPQRSRAIIDDCLQTLTPDTQLPRRFITTKGSDFRGLPPAAIPVDIELAEPYQSGIHFALYRYADRLGVYWQGLRQSPSESARGWQAGDFAHLASARGRFDARYAAADCIFSLHIERGYSVEAAVSLVYELALPVHTLIEENKSAVTAPIEQLKVAEFVEHWSRLSPAARQTIEATIRALPEAERDQACYNLAFLIAPLPKKPC